VTGVPSQGEAPSTCSRTHNSPMMPIEASISMARAMAPQRPIRFEEPMRVDRPLAEWKTLAATSPIPLGGGENLRGADFDLWHEAGASTICWFGSLDGSPRGHRSITGSQPQCRGGRKPNVQRQTARFGLEALRRFHPGTNVLRGHAVPSDHSTLLWKACRNPALRQALGLEPQDLTDLPHRQSLLGHSPCSSVERERGPCRFEDHPTGQRVHAIHTPDAMVRNRWTPSVGTGGGRHLPDTAVVINRYAHALIRLLREHGGKIVAGQRVIGRTLGVLATHINRVLAKLSQAASYLLMGLGAAQSYG
jgi:hypothetical protein